MTTTDGGFAPGEPIAQSRLHRRALGVPDLVFFIVAASAPLTAIAGGEAAAYLVTGNKGLPLVYLPVAIALGIFAFGYAAMSQHVADAGAFYTYITRGWGKVIGVASGFGALVSYNAMSVGIYGLFGVATAGFMADKVGITLDWYWWCLLAAAIIAVLGVLQVDLNAKVLAVFLIAEVIIVAIFDFAVLADPGPAGLAGTGWNPSEALGTNFGATMCFVVASFVGFESAAIYSEECRDPQRTVARATFIAVGLIAVFYAFSMWLVANSIGPDTMVNPEALVKGGFTADGENPDPTTVFFIAGGERLNAFWADLALALFCTSLFAALLSFHNSVARYLFALGREHVLPRAVGRVSLKTGAPVVGSIVQTVIAMLGIIVFAAAGTDPVLEMFTWLSNLGALGVLFLMMITSVSVVLYFQKHPAPELGAWRTKIAPAIAAVLMATIGILAVLNFNVLITGLTDAPLDKMTVILPLTLALAGIVGVIVAMYLKSNNPDAYHRIGEHTEVEVQEHIEE